MTKTIILTTALMLCGMASCAAGEKESGSFTVQLPADYKASTVVISHASLDEMLKNSRNFKVEYDTVAVSSGKAVMTLDPAGPARYSVEVAPQVNADMYAAPGETIVMDIKSVNPLDYTVAGTALMEGMTKLGDVTGPIEKEFAEAAQSGTATEKQISDIYKRYDEAVKAFLKDNSNSPAAAYAMLNLGGQAFLDAYEALGPEAKVSILMPFVEQRKARAIKEAEGEKFQQSLAAGTVEAPDFTLPDLNGKQVSLKDFRGKWVIIDFWGSWCKWCIKGFPSLKEAYKKYAGKVEVIGVDCRESQEAWRAAVERLELPWVNLYNADTEGGVLAAYMVTGFPTKAIISPEGKLVDIIVGEEPDFYDKLERFVNGGK